MSTASQSFLKEWADAQALRGPSMKKQAIFYRNLENELDAARSQSLCAMFHLSNDLIDFSSSDGVSLGTSGAVKSAFLSELAANPDFQLGSHGTRLLNGNSAYLEMVENEIAEFHGAESALLLGSGALANEAIFAAIVRPGDAIVYDELVHASTHYGMKNSLALVQRPFRHNDVDAFAETLIAVRDSQPLIQSGQRSVIIAVESFYSMDGDICPLRDLVEAAKDVFPNGNAQFVMDEAHSTGNIGPRGSGLVNLLGLENEIAVRNHTYGKSLAGSGAAIVSNMTVRRMLINNAKSVLYSTAPGFLAAASTRVAYNLLKAGATQQGQEKIQHLIKLFLNTISENPIWDKANDGGFLRIPLSEEDWNHIPFLSQIVPVFTKPKHNLYLAVHLQLGGFCVYPISTPVVPKGTDRVRLVFHAHNTDHQVEGLATSICDWAKETMECEAQNRLNRQTSDVKLCKAAQVANSLITSGNMDGRK
ncbi:class II aminotransferase/8-amino-7-oxononanoate synthase [Moelleriella libera RCEF 2490]|uniref:Class II aminotransferase/8-amino-7-oxononanoate synthase n=1 Tax=Moelleriella libera RCEF 2490 TaxID=1081109 RepID=A0A167VHL8_9HYPO|nr:class II aminotransferase/8-amino-7-oxononanoate synthase [Moelleriella libera RCEF 2490]